MPLKAEFKKDLTENSAATEGATRQLTTVMRKTLDPVVKKWRMNVFIRLLFSIKSRLARLKSRGRRSTDEDTNVEDTDEDTEDLVADFQIIFQPENDSDDFEPVDVESSFSEEVRCN